MERIFHDVSLRAMYRKPLTSRARDAAHELGTVRKCFVQALKRLARPPHPIGAGCCGRASGGSLWSLVCEPALYVALIARHPVCLRCYSLYTSYEAPYSMGSNFDKSVGGHVHALREYNSRSLLYMAIGTIGTCTYVV
jgi:hypothetical protein